jgi:hypothetical protein
LLFLSPEFFNRYLASLALNSPQNSNQKQNAQDQGIPQKTHRKHSQVFDPLLLLPPEVPQVEQLDEEQVLQLELLLLVVELR